LMFTGTFVFCGQFEDGKEIFWDKCAVCHTGHIDADKVKKNFFEQNNTVLMLGAPTVNMLAYAITEGPRHIGDPNDSTRQQAKIEKYLADVLYHPKRENSICDPRIIKFYDIKQPLEEKLSKNEISSLSKFFMEYKKHQNSKQRTKSDTPMPQTTAGAAEGFDAQSVLDRAKKENKNIIIEASTPSCPYCQKMKHEVFAAKDVRRLLDRGYIFADINVESSRLPYGLDRHYKQATPSFFILDGNGRLMFAHPGAFSKDDFVNILKRYIPKSKQ